MLRYFPRVRFFLRKGIPITFFFFTDKFRLESRSRARFRGLTILDAFTHTHHITVVNIRGK